MRSNTRHGLSRLASLGICLLIVLCVSQQVHAQAPPLQVRFLTFNVNFNSTVNKTRADVQAVSSYADILMFQEAKNVTIDDFLGSAWTVYQVVDQGDARRGSALAVRNSIISRRLAQGLVKGVEAGTADMLDRYIAWMDIELTNGQLLRIMALHFPPKRLIALQPPMADTFVSFANNSPYPVVAGADWNFTVDNDPYNIQSRTGLIPRGVGIDGFFRDRSVVKFASITKLTSLNVNSDHDPVQMVSDVTTPGSGVVDWSTY